MRQASTVGDILLCSIVFGEVEQPIHITDRTLDRALQKAWEQELFPKWVRDLLHFAEARTGLVCVELEGIISYWVNSTLVAFSDTSYTKIRVAISKRAIEDLADRTRIAAYDLRQWGTALAICLEETKLELIEFQEKQGLRL